MERTYTLIGADGLPYVSTTPGTLGGHRRTRLGLTTADGGVRTALEFRPALQTLLGWDDDRWDRELSRYRDLWRDYYGPPVP